MDAIIPAEIATRGPQGVYRYSHLLYNGTKHKAFGVVRLNHEAAQIFGDSIWFKHRRQIFAEDQADARWVKQASGRNMPPAPAIHHYIENLVLDYLKLGTGFELHLKARLLHAGFVIHQLENREVCKDLWKQQPIRPIAIDELFEITGYEYDGRYHCLAALSGKSVPFDRLVNKRAYREVLRLPEDILDGINAHRELRNNIHLPGDAEAVSTPPELQALGPDFAIKFANAEIVGPTNALVAHYGFKYPPLAPFWHPGL